MKYVEEMLKKKQEKLILKYCTNQISAKQLKKLKRWVKTDDNKLIFEKYISLNQEIEHLNKRKVTVDKDKMWNNINTRINAKKRRNLFWKYGVAAGLLIVISLSLIFIKKETEIKISNSIEIDNDIPIGTDKATLTLENGVNVVLKKNKTFNTKGIKSNGEEIVYVGNNKVDITEVEYNYLTIPRGGKFHLKLADGTLVWLNSESKLKYPKKFVEGKSREVELLYGEAYFDVSPSEYHNGTKFIVHTQIQDVTVLGTEFNIKAYHNDETIFTTLVEGKVAVTNDIANVFLKVGEQSEVNLLANDNEIAVNTVNLKSVLAWRKGLFSFQDKSLFEITKVLSRWYDVDFEFHNDEAKQVRFKGVLSKNQNVEEILLLIKNTGYIESYEINEDNIKIE